MRLQPVTAAALFRVAKLQYGPLSAPARHTGSDPAAWGRFDSPAAATLYTASTRDAAYMEVLSPFKRALGPTDPLQADADAVGLTRDEFLEAVATDWDERSFMGVGAVPASWRHARGMYRITPEGSGWWIDVDHPDTIAATEHALEEGLARLGVTSLTTATLAGPDRRVTTMIGGFLHGLAIEDDTHVCGIRFRSKFGGATCQAVWLPHADLKATRPERILATDPDLAHAADRFRIHVF